MNKTVQSLQRRLIALGFPLPKGEALFAWRSAVWTYSTAELAKVTAGSVHSRVWKSLSRSCRSSSGLCCRKARRL